MNRLLAWASAMDDGMNPIAVKEFRQSVQSRGAITILMLFLLVNLCVVGGYVMLSPDADTSLNGGRYVFLGLLGILQFTGMLIVPLYSATRMSRERNAADVDLLYVTTLSPGTIVRGKYLTTMALTLLIFSASMPFLILTYLLRGVDLPTIFYLLAASFVICAVANAAGIFAGSVPGKGFLRGIGYVAFFLILPLFPQLIAVFELSLVSGISGVMGTWSFWAANGTCALLAALVVGFFYVLSVAIMSPKPSNRMLIPRLYVTGAWVLTGVVAYLWALGTKVVHPIAGWVVVSGIAWMIFMATALGERDAWSARVRRMIPRDPLRRLVAFLFYTGSAGGIGWCVLMFALTIAAAMGIVQISSGFAWTGAGDLGEVCGNMPIVFGYILCYCLTTAFLRHTVLKNAPTTVLPVIAGFLGVSVFLLPYLAAFFIERNWWYSLPWFLLASPTVLMMGNKAAAHAATPVVVVWLVLSFSLSVPWIIGQWKRFTPYHE